MASPLRDGSFDVAETGDSSGASPVPYGSLHRSWRWGASALQGSSQLPLKFR